MSRTEDLPEAQLSDRERDIAQAYAKGDAYREIAARLCIAPSTVRTHLATIYRKLGVSSKLQLHKALHGGGTEAAEQQDMTALVSELALSLEEAISRERALAEVLRIISRSNGRLEDVIAAVLGHALDLCDAEFGILFEHSAEAGYRAAYVKGIPKAFSDWLDEAAAFHPSPATALGRVAASHEVINIPDVKAEAIFKRNDPLRDATANLGGARSFTAIPMLTGDRLIGAFTIYRQTVRPFNAKALEIASMFADQSVIAIENARLLANARGA